MAVLQRKQRWWLHWWGCKKLVIWWWSTAFLQEQEVWPAAARERCNCLMLRWRQGSRTTIALLILALIERPRRSYRLWHVLIFLGNKTHKHVRLYFSSLGIMLDFKCPIYCGDIKVDEIGFAAVPWMNLGNWLNRGNEFLKETSMLTFEIHFHASWENVFWEI